MIISLDSISKNFRLFNDQDKIWQDRSLLTEFVDHWKIVFVEKNKLKSGNHIGLGFPLTDIYYFSALIAAAELGLKLVVLDISNQSIIPPDNKLQSDSFFPLDLFLSGKMLKLEKHNYYSAHSRQTEYWHIWDSYQTNSSGWWNNPTRSTISPDLDLLLCTSSGTTDKPKKVNHTHKFLFNVSQRNNKLFKFDGNVLHIRNLHHGSSLVTYFIPALMSDTCQGHFVFNLESVSYMESLVRYCVDHDINHVQFPHVHMAENFLKQAVSQNYKFNNLTIYILSYINPDWQSLINQCGTIKIVSVFGCNETSGPLFTNVMHTGQTDFDHKTFELADNFYSFDFNDQNQLLVNLNDYGTSIVIQDTFQRHGNIFTHLGRNDLVRINDVKVDLFWLLELAKIQDLHAQIVVDRDREKLYLAVWDQSDLDHTVAQLNLIISNKYDNQVYIASAKHLVFEECLLGIKLDHEVIRNIFRTDI